MIRNVTEAYDLLEKLAAPKRLVQHANLVEEAASILIEQCRKANVEIDGNLVRIGTVLHDCGKIQMINELSDIGSEHEITGEKILKANKVQPEIARCCRSHARWEKMDCSLEELVIALSDNLWKGKRIETLELIVIDQIAEKTGKNRWDIFTDWDECFEGSR